MAECAACTAPLPEGAQFCQYCGAAAPSSDPPYAVPVEGDLAAKLPAGGGAPAGAGFGREVRTMSCESCGATVSWDPAQMSATCAYCGSNAVVEQPASDEHRPSRVVAFSLDRNGAMKRFNDWLGKGWFRPRDLQTRSLIKEMRGVYLPFWAFDADADSTWTASAGYHYTVQEPYTTRDAQGRTVSGTRSVTKTRWEPAAGSHRDRYDDWMIPATKGLALNLLNKIFPFRTEEAKAYDPLYLAGFGAERPAVRADEVRQNAANALYEKERAACAAMVPGDVQRDLNVNTHFSNWAYDLVLLPLWVSSYRYQDRVFRFLINGQTGEVQGEAPISKLRVAIAIVAAILGLGVAATIFGVMQG